MRSKPSRTRNAKGQAVIESLVVIGVMATLGALAVALGKVQLAAQSGYGASHSIAFECAVIPQRCAAPQTVASSKTRQRVRRDHFTSEATGLVQIAAWTDRSGSPMLSDASDVTLALSHPHFGAGVGVAGNGAGSAIGSAARLLSKFAGPGRFGLEIGGGIVTAKVRVDLMQDAQRTNTPDLLNRMPLSLTTQSAILTDHWNASHPYGAAPTSVQVRVDRGKKLSRVMETGFKVAYAPTRASMLFMWGLLLESDARKFEYHELDMDLIPADRIGR